MENVSSLSLRRLGVVSALIALVASLLVVPAQQAAVGNSVSVPDAPNLTEIIPGRGQLTVAFTQASDGGDAITNYEYSIDGGAYKAFSPSKTESPVVIDKLSRRSIIGGKEYSVTLRAVNSVGESSASNSLSSNTLRGPDSTCFTNHLYFAGSGTSSSPYVISSADDLQSLSDCVSATTRPEPYNDTAVYYKQTGDIDWIDDAVIGGTKPFEANYDGGGYAIHSFSQTLSTQYTALFGGGSDCTISNLTVSGSVTNTRTSSASAGIVMGSSTGCSFDNVTAFGELEGGTGSSTQTGGILGYGSSGTSITDSTSHVDLTARSGENGGIVGYLNDGSMTDVSASREADPWDSDQNRGKVVVTVHDSSAGGMAGFLSDSTVTRATSSVDLEGTYTTAASGMEVGGLVGYLGSGGSVTASSSSGTLTFNDAVGSVGEIGGLVGDNAGSPISTSFSTATLDVFVDSTGRSVGGLVGTSDADINRSYFAGTIEVDEKSAVDLSQIGGLVGNLVQGTVSKSYANVTMTGDATFPAGFVGRAQSQASITDSFAFGAVTASDPAGFLGWNDNSSVTNSFTFVEVAEGVSGGDLHPVRRTGGSVDSTVYWNATQAGVLSEPSGSGGTELRDSETSTQSSFSGFDFSSTWTMGCAPYLTWLGSSPAGLCTAAVPNAPTITGITAGNGQLIVAFTAGSDGGAAISNYKYSTDGSTYTALSPADATTPVTITGLTNGTSYSVTLKAVNSVGDSAASNAVSGTPVAPTPPPADPSPSPSPSPAPAPAPEPDPTPAPAPRPAAVPTPPAEPPVVSTPARPSTPPAPTPPPAADPAPEAPAGPGAVFLRAEEIFEGTITLGNDTEELIMPAFVLQDIATHLAPDGAPLEEGALVIESGATMIAVLIIQLGDVRLSAADMGNAIQFTLNIPGFESSSMTVAVQKQALVWAFWIQMGLLGVSAAIAVTMVWLFVARNRRRKNDGGPSGQRMNLTPPPPPMRPAAALGI